MQPYVSIVIPVYNEQDNLMELFKRLYPVMENLERQYEIIFTNDGSKDQSFALLLSLYEQHPAKVKIIDFNGNFGQHMAIMAAFAQSKGQIVITMDADLQNPPEEIPRLIQAMEQGYDVVGTYRANRHDPLFRKIASKIVNKVTAKITGIRLRDYGCMLRAYSRRIIDHMNQCHETTTFIPALAQKFAMNATEIEVGHAERQHGQSKYGLYHLIRLNFDLMTGFSVVPLQVVTMFGLAVAAGSFLFGAYLLIRRLFVGPEAEGVFTLLDLNFFLMGITMFAVGIVGEYIGRIYQEVRQRPRYIIKRVFGDEA